MRRRVAQDERGGVPERLWRFRREDWVDQVDRTIPDTYQRDDDPDGWLLISIRAARLWSEARRHYQAEKGWPPGTLQRLLHEADVRRDLHRGYRS